MVNQQTAKTANVNRHTGGLENRVRTRLNLLLVNRHTGGLEI